MKFIPPVLPVLTIIFLGTALTSSIQAKQQKPQQTPQPKLSQKQ
ncbi:hypothetical protein [Scytonema sp. HK-05]|nr:hypothetical protein [Scytonema sp. HK-05]